MQPYEGNQSHQESLISSPNLETSLGSSREEFNSRITFNDEGPGRSSNIVNAYYKVPAPKL